VARHRTKENGMGFKTGLLIGFGAGYVLGSKAGRQRYDEIRRAWGRLSGSPTVHRAAERTRELAGDSMRQGLHAVQTGVERAGTAVKERLAREDDLTDTVVDRLEEYSGSPPEKGPATAHQAFRKENR
jgi:hypothetical protein